MSQPVTLITAESDYLAVTATATPFGVLGMTPDRDYMYVCTQDSWIAQSDLVVDASDNPLSPVATAGAGSTFVPALFPVYLDGARGDALSVIRDAADGQASLTPISRDKIGA